MADWFDVFMGARFEGVPEEQVIDDVIALSQRDLDAHIVDAIVEQSARDAESGAFTCRPLPVRKPKSIWTRLWAAATQLLGRA